MTSSQPATIQEEILQDSNEDMFKLLLEFKDYAILRIDSSGHVISWNLGAAEIYGFNSRDIIGKHISKFYSDKEIQDGQPWLHLKKAIEKGRFEHEGWRRKKNGGAFYANIILTALYNEDGVIRGFAKVVRDITLQKKLQEENKILTEQLEEKVKNRTRELEIVNKELEAFSYSVSHDLRAPLRAVSGYANILKEDYEASLDAEGNRLIDVIVDNAKMMGNLIDDLLSFSKMSRLEVITVAIDMKQLADKCVKELLQVEKRKDCEIIVHPLPESKGDANMLKQVWMNLVGNAMKYSSKKTSAKIEIGAIENEKNVVYFIKDNGTGFDMKYANKLFGVFQRLHRQDEFEGTGLGLALAKRIITKHGGEIWAEASLNEGASFYFSLPKNNADEQEV